MKQREEFIQVTNYSLFYDYTFSNSQFGYLCLQSELERDDTQVSRTLLSYLRKALDPETGEKLQNEDLIMNSLLFLYQDLMIFTNIAPRDMRLVRAPLHSQCIICLKTRQDGRNLWLKSEALSRPEII